MAKALGWGLTKGYDEPFEVESALTTTSPMIVLVDEDIARGQARVEVLWGAGFRAQALDIQSAQELLRTVEDVIIVCGSGFPQEWSAPSIRLGSEGAPAEECSSTELLSALKALLRGRSEGIEIGLKTGILRLGEYRFLGPAGEVMVTPLEVDVLQYLWERSGEACSRDELLVHVWGYRAGMATRAIDQTIARLRAKIEQDKSAPEHLVSVRGVGYRLNVPPLSEAWSSPAHSEEAAVEVLPVEPAALPANLDQCVGREREIASVLRLLEEGSSPLLTVSGSAGVGKSRLLLEVAVALRTLHPQRPLAYADLSNAQDQADLLSAVANALGIGAHVGLPVLVAALRESEVFALFLDNGDGVSEPLLQWVRTLLRECRNVRLIVGLRSPLVVRGETHYPLAPLEPEEAFTLYLERSGQSLADMNTEEQEANREIVQRLDGVPLAIEVVASRSHMFSPQGLLGRIEKNLLKLRSRLSGVDDRQRSLFNALDCAWQDLTADERALLRQCAVFRGPFTLDALESIIDASVFCEPDALDLVLQGVVQKSWLQSGRSLDARERRCFTWLRSTHRFVCILLETHASLEPGLRTRHASYYGNLWRASGPEFAGYGVKFRTRLQLMRHNKQQLLAAVEWAQSQGGDGEALLVCQISLCLAQIMDGVEITGTQFEALEVSVQGSAVAEAHSWLHIAQGLQARRASDASGWAAAVQRAVSAASQPEMAIELLQWACAENAGCEEWESAQEWWNQGAALVAMNSPSSGILKEQERLRRLLPSPATSKNLQTTQGKSVFLVCSDVVESTRQWNQQPEQFARRLYALTSKTRALLEELGGYEVHMDGDGILVSFDRADSMVQFCQQLATFVRTEKVEGQPLLSLRLVMHSTAAVSRRNPVTGRRDFVGVDVRQVHQMSKLCPPGCCLISERVREVLATLGVESERLHGFETGKRKTDPALESLYLVDL